MDWQQLQQWLPAVLGLLGGGAVGAMITATVTSFRSRIQPVGFRVEPLTMFRGVSNDRGVKLKVSLESDGQVYNFPNLHAIDVEIVNRGNADKPSFEFGVTLSELEKAVFVETTKTDRHHVFTTVPLASPTEPSNELDFVVAPFNRGDRYRFTAYVTLPPGKDLIGKISFSSPLPVVFTPMETMGEIGMTIVKAAAIQNLSIGGVQVAF